MNILILLEITSYGGHVLSALTTGKALQKRGHNVHFAAGSGPMAEEIAKIFPFNALNFYYTHGNQQTYFTWRSFKTLKELAEVVKKGQYDHIHAFDARSYILGSMLAIAKKTISVTCTLCGGIAPYFNLPHCEKIIVFSQEQKRKFIDVFGWRDDNVEVISTRLDMEQFSAPESDEILEICRKHKIDPRKKNIIMITNFIDPKVPAIRYVLESMQDVLKKYEDLNLIMVGGRGSFFQQAIQIGQGINVSCGRNAVIFTGPVKNAYRFIPYAFVVLGSGRGAFEGMAYEKPTLIVGERGYAGSVKKENIEEIAYFNFSGRNLTQIQSPEKMADEIVRIIENETYCESLKTYGKEYLKQHIDIMAGIEKIEEIYKVNATYSQNTGRLRKLYYSIKALSPIILNNYYGQVVLSSQRLKRFLNNILKNR